MDEHLHRILEALPVAAIAVGPTGPPLHANAAARRLLGPRADLPPESWGLRLPGPEAVPPGKLPHRRALAGEQAPALELILGDPPAPVRVHARLAGPDLAIVSIEELGELGALRDRLRFCEQVVDSVAHPIFVKDRQFRFALLNRALGTLVGRPVEEMLGRTDYDFFPEEQADFFRKKDEEMFRTRREVVIEEEPITDSAGRVHVLATTKVPLFDADGEVTHLAGIIHDITQLKEAEAALRRNNEELAQAVAEKTAALERLDAARRDLEALSFSVSHDLGAPLRVIDDFSRVLEREHGGDLSQEGQRLLRRVRANVDELGRLIEAHRGLSRAGQAALVPGPVDLAAVAREIEARLRASEPDRSVELVVGELPRARGDAGMLRAVLEVLLGNAWKFTRPRAVGRVELGADPSPAAETGSFWVRDNGVGFDPAQAGQLFRPFVRLHRPDEFEGTGIGLAAAARIVGRHGGRIWAEAAPGAGATFRFTLPSDLDPAAPARDPHAPAGANGR